MSETLQFKLLFDQDLDAYLKSSHPDIVDYRILSKSLDARGAPRGKAPNYLYTIEAIKAGEDFKPRHEKFRKLADFEKPPLIIGAGPAGLFAALRFAEYGIRTVIIERGDEANKRMLHISKYWRKGELNPESNVCYGEGGAGLFSDGKLITRVKSDYIQYVMNKFVEFGAPEEVAYISNPHLGSNKIRKIITKISDYLKEQGHEIFYNIKATEILFENYKAVGAKLSDGRVIHSDHVILASGHSAGEMYHHLHEAGVAIRPKDFAVGVRIEHPRVEIDKMQHGRFAEAMEAARYRLSHHNKETDKGTYSFCMCPGGYVLSSGTEADGIVVNGMSNYARNSRWSNSALVVTVKAGEDFKIDDPLAGMDFQHEIEQRAYQLSKEKADGRMLPAMTVGEFLKGRLDTKELPKTSSPSGIFKADIRPLFPEFICHHLKEALLEFNKKLKGFAYNEALLIAPETRTSAPITILRDKNSLVSTSHEGLYPCGEGAGYAGGITSAAADGIKVVEQILND
ncbi:MAG: hypothetical protein CME65_08005 [Halobacteriovoraceae bacterium]|nr:hypothetical protein [Halobacteriovoraceae bacterium]|tara:strand:- start:4200 stop:5735 length:1536 start_codon:yes stop_codon:yes gene_type:complete